LNQVDSSIDHEADLLIAVLDSLEVDNVGILAWSGGGPVAYRLAVKYPDRISSLVQISAVSSQWVMLEYDFSSKFLFGTAFGNWLVHVLAPGQLIEGALASEGSVLRGEELQVLVKSVMSDDKQRNFVLAIACKNDELVWSS